MSFRPPPSRLELIRLRRQLALFQRMKKTLEDARNSTVQRIRALVLDLEKLRREIADGFVEVAENFKIAVAKSGIDKIESIAELTPKTVRVELINRGTHVGLEVSNYVTYPTYSIASEAAELDIALAKMRSLLEKLIEFAEKETLFYTLLNRVREYQRMINAIDYVVIPRIKDNIQYIRLALEEAEREEFIRRKIIVAHQ
ncbi:V-type ATP synthase subunit D [Pyrobaculum aerophilum]|uniref:H+-transporting ATP synthase subunit D (AtpD) n=2 Tax=Pyrobaculum aerophilum TaxID=13773 RepID=Q8ZYI5_PYRAE|nr:MULTISPECIES: V-type ATP synthase subunit D [Pyrobaculum]AAL63008.1 H+-transporting ATP synthase subunit D (atpD) [Pyrobaculum aerophilum str. IM2]MCX8136203.1 V-type ATP synthase subunit D [Pyrobaculum aerophilum]RFA97428.1 V-type ATP synthase subunit D [Pyrobaculum aerophilum]RFA97491.1 V-type ATP synthase subunit D [Pyrobaculum aerophilum]HII48221.1 V-type ATP synthase subunit D [Pyrobaculum aerophilum]